MRWCPFFIAIVFLVTRSFGAGEEEDSKSENSSNLTTVYNELATVTRITNAIALQSAAIKKSVKVSDVITELLKTDSKNFTILMTYNLKMLEGAMEHLNYSTADLRNFKKEKWDNLEAGRKWLDAVTEEFGCVEDLQIFGKSENINAFFDKVYAPEFQDNFLPCSSFQNLSTYGKFLGSENENVQKSGVEYIGNFTEDIQECFENLADSKKLQNFQNFKSEIENFQKLKNSLTQFGTIATPSIPPSDYLTLVEKIYSTTKKLWSKNGRSKRESRVDQNPTTGAIFHEAMATLNSMFPMETEPEITLTVGFLEPGDMAKVEEDLKSEWFLEKVGRGKSMENLRKELDGFFQFGEQMKTLGERWENFKIEFMKHKGSGSMLARQMVDVDSFKNPEEKMEEIKNFKIHYPEKCGTLKETKFDLVKKFEGLEILMEVHGFVGAMSETIEKFPEVSIKGLENDLREFNTTTSSSEILKKFPDEQQFSNLKKLIEGFTKLDEQFQQHFSRIRKLRTEDSFAKKVMVENTTNAVNSLKSIRECVKSLKSSHLNPQNLTDVVNYIARVRALSDVGRIQESLNVLKLFSAFKNQTLTVEQFVRDIGPKYVEKDHEDNPVLKLENPMEMLLSLGRGMIVLRDMSRAWNSRKYLLESIHFPEKFSERVLQYIHIPSVQNFWPKREQEIPKLIEELSKLNDFAGTVKDKGILTMRKILDEATKVHGFPEVFKHLWNYFKMTQASENQTVIEALENLEKLDMDFASHKGYLHAASLSFDELRIYFDDVFGINKQHHHEVEHNYLTATLLCLGVFLLILITVVLILSLTKSGRKRIRRLYLYYFAKPQDYEKRWRYSLFMDRVEQKNALHDAVREINPTNTLKCVKKGAYINVFNQHGNTPLHVATKRGYPEIVEILIKNGADRAYLNAKNKTPEEMIPKNWRESQTTASEGTERYDEVEKIYKKYRKRKFRARVPEEFPWSSFHIYLDNSTDEAVTDEFMHAFQSVTSFEASPNTTHRVVHTDSEGIFEIEDLETVLWILSGVIIVRETWMTDCLKNRKLIQKDSKYLVEKVRYKGVVYDTVLQWSMAMAKGAIPYLHGVYVVVLIPEYPGLVNLATIVTAHGGLFCSNQLPERGFFKPDAHPYLHVHLGPIFLIHDGNQNLETYKNDAIYSIFTETEFVAFMLKRGINVDTRPDPVPVMTESDD